MNRAFAALLALVIVAPPLRGQGERSRLSFDAGWRFTLGDPAGAERPAFDDSRWRRLDLPHDWSIEATPDEHAPGGGRMGFLPGGVGWYRKAFTLPSGATGRLISLEFNGVYMDSDVWINGVHLGRRPYGYISFAYDITAHLVRGTNVVAVRVDNSAQPNSRWYSGSGIYRHVWLTIVNPFHVGHWGITITTPRIDSTRIDVVVRTIVINRGTGPVQHGLLRSVVLDSTGREVAHAENPLAMGRDTIAILAQRITIPSPQLWSVDHPTMYRLRTVLLGDRKQTTDDVVTPFGIRTIAFDKDQGFLLNGRRVKLRGVNLHHDGGAVGAAVPERLWEVWFERLKAMGANAIRTSHNPPAPEFLDLCDRLGFLVMAEAFDEWTMGKVPEGYHKYFAEWSERDVTDFVQRDRNHPSIVLWSAGNEIGEQTTGDGVDVLRRLVGIFHREDATRLVTTGNDQIDADGHPATLAFLAAEDVVGYNYVDRWHERRELFAEQDRHDHPDWRMVGTESGNIFTTFSESYSLGDSMAVVRPNYTTGMIEAERLWKWVELHDYFAGNFMWSGVDYLGESVWPFIGFSSGALDFDSRPKDAYYLYQSLWTDQPVLHLFPHWSWPGREGQMIPVMVYTNCSSVELFLNGKSLGEKSIEFPAQGTSGGWNSYALPVVRATTNDVHLSWDVPYAPGVLRAVGKRRDGTVSCHDELRTAGPAAAIRLSADRDTVTTGPGDVSLVSFEIVDSAGTVVPTANTLVRFTVTGGTIVVLSNADLADHDSFTADHRKAYDGRGLAIVRAARPGVMTVTASGAAVLGASVRVEVRSARAP
jgi:beta-galactosidase